MNLNQCSEEEKPYWLRWDRETFGVINKTSRVFQLVFASWKGQAGGSSGKMKVNVNPLAGILFLGSSFAVDQRGLIKVA